MSVFVKNYYSSIQQYSKEQLRFFDEGPRIYNRTIGINSSSIDTRDVDAFRQGVEITQEKHTLGMFKILAGTPGHIVDPNSYGVTNVDISSEDYYKEVEYFDPVTYISLQEPDLDYSTLFTFPIITPGNDGKESLILNGIIEPLSIRPVLTFSSIEWPFESHSFRVI